MRLPQLKNLVVKALEDLKAFDIKVIDVRGVSNVTDMLVIASGGSDRQVKALANHVIEKVKGKGLQPLGVEGEQIGEWALVDLGDVVVHIMVPQTRAFYNLEKLWSDAAQPDAELAKVDAHISARRKKSARP